MLFFFKLVCNNFITKVRYIYNRDMKGSLRAIIQTTHEKKKESLGKRESFIADGIASNLMCTFPSQTFRRQLSYVNTFCFVSWRKWC